MMESTMGFLITTEWVGFLLSAALLAAYEIRVHWVGRRSPSRMARYAHAKLRVDWVEVLSAASPGFEIVAVQSLRNSLMSATITASTAALALMGSVSLAGAKLAAGIAHLDGLALRYLLEALLMLVLFASFVCSAMSMRYFNHVGFVMSMPVASERRKPLVPMAAQYVERAGLLYSWGLRLFLMVAPLVAGIVNALAMLPVTITLIVALWFFDRPAEALGD
jgi:hypothetical protein